MDEKLKEILEICDRNDCLFNFKLVPGTFYGFSWTVQGPAPWSNGNGVTTMEVCLDEALEWVRRCESGAVV